MIIDVQFEEMDASFVTLFEEMDASFEASFETNDLIFSAVFGEFIKVYDDVPLYDGEYEVTPRVNEQTLPTAQRFLARDVKIEKIPYFEVSNSSGGKTVSIGEV